MQRIRGASDDGLWRRVAGVIGMAGESRALQRCDLAVDSASIGSGGGVLSLASECKVPVCVGPGTPGFDYVHRHPTHPTTAQYVDATGPPTRDHSTWGYSMSPLLLIDR